MIRSGRRGRVLLLGIATGGVLLSGVAVGSSATAVAAAAPSAASAAPAARDVVTATNRARRAAGCGPVRVDDRLEAGAQAHATDMARNDDVSHTSADGTTSAERIGERGYPNANAENIASGYPRATEVMAAWMGSATHRRNIENCRFTAIGVGYDPDGHHWVQDFGG